MSIFGKMKRGAESVGKWSGKAAGDVISAGGKVVGGAGGVLHTVEKVFTKSIEQLKNLPGVGDIVKEIMSQPLPMVDMSADEIVEIVHQNVEQTENLLDALEESSQTVKQVIDGNANFKTVMSDFENIAVVAVPRLLGLVESFDETGNTEIANGLLNDPDVKEVNNMNKKMASMLS
eukprot:TRINITY_DN2679_c0_g1_i3.p2 TRINITY_DN2679_c0_g1~~TRINITY_DN2679_c0_g1_i3.p2  ORF type:complete len:176 (-),score=58.13 TRINITY_DN2679_c0_g1_i3:363-890(-)